MVKSIVVDDDIKKQLDEFKSKYGFLNFSEVMSYLLYVTGRLDEKELLQDTFNFRNKNN